MIIYCQCDVMLTMMFCCPHRSQTLQFFCLLLHFRHRYSVSSLFGLGDGVMSKLLYSLYVVCEELSSSIAVDSQFVLAVVVVPIFGKYGRKYPIPGDPEYT